MNEPYLIKLFDKALHDRSAFSCGVEAIDRWLRESVSDQIRENRLRLWCATDRLSGRLIGFYALNTHSLTALEAPVLARRSERLPIPTIYLPVLAIASDLQGAGLGKTLMAHAIQRAGRLSEEIAIKAIILDVLDDEKLQQRLAFYRSLGFQQPGHDPRRLFLSIEDAKASTAANKQRTHLGGDPGTAGAIKRP